MTVVDILCLPGWVVHSIENTGDHLLIEAGVDEGPSACPFCGSVIPPYHFGSRSRCIADLPIRMQSVQIRARRRRYRCRDYGSTFLDQLPGIHRQHDATEQLVEYIQSHSMTLTGTFMSLACAMGVSEYFIRNVFAAHVEQLEREYVIQTPRYMGIDEIYAEDAVYCVITDLERHCMVDLLPKRNMETVKRWLAALQCPETVEVVMMDLWNPYRLSVREVLPHACIVADKYHVLRRVNEIVDDLGARDHWYRYLRYQ